MADPVQFPGPEVHAVSGTRLDQLSEGSCGDVCDVAAGSEEVDRLKAMGVCNGRRVMLVRRGDPMIIRVLGSRLGLSARLARTVYVRPCGADACAAD